VIGNCFRGCLFQGVQTEVGLILRKNTDKMMRQAAISYKKFVNSQWSMTIFFWLRFWILSELSSQLPVIWFGHNILLRFQVPILKRHTIRPHGGGWIVALARTDFVGLRPAKQKHAYRGAALAQFLRPVFRRCRRARIDMKTRPLQGWILSQWICLLAMRDKIGNRHLIAADDNWLAGSLKI
jgi:hypothetical protein